MLAEKVLNEGICGYKKIRILRQTIIERIDFIEGFDKRAIYKVQIEMSSMTSTDWHTIAEWSTNYGDKEAAVLNTDIVRCKMKAIALFKHMIQYGKL